jgi:hypothetical protein
LLLLPAITSLVSLCKSSGLAAAGRSSKGDTGTGCSHILWRSTSDLLINALPHFSHLSIGKFPFRTSCLILPQTNRMRCQVELSPIGHFAGEGVISPAWNIGRYQNSFN